MSLARLTSGLMARDLFATPVGWTLGNLMSVFADPALTVSERTPIICLAPGTNIGVDSDAGGVRESNIAIDWVGTWWLFYGAGDGSNPGAGGPWRPQVAKSTNRGLSWTKYGPLSFGLAVRNNPSDGFGSYVARDQLYAFSDATNNWWHNAMSATVADSNQIPDGVYSSDLYTITGGSPNGTWVWNFRDEDPNTSSGGFWDTRASGSCYMPIGNSWLWLQTVYSSFEPHFDNFIVFTGPSASGPWTIANAWNPPYPTTGPFAYKYSHENPKMFYHNGLQGWIVLANVVILFEIGNCMYWTQTPITWTAPTSRLIHRASPNWSTSSYQTMGLSSPVLSTGGIPAITAKSGFVPVTYDCDPTDGNHIGRKIRYVVEEPCFNCLRYNDVGSNNGTATRLLQHSDFTAEFYVEIITGSGAINFDYRVQANGDSYRVVLNQSAGVVLQVSSGGVYSNIGTSSGTLTVGVSQIVAIRISVAGSTHQVWMDGEVQINVSNPAFASGSSIRYTGVGPIDARVRNLNIRRSNTLTVTGLSAGQTVTVRSAQMPVETATASGPTVTFTHTHWPAETVDVNGVDHSTNDGLLWGGDTVAVVNPGVVALNPKRQLRGVHTPRMTAQ